MLHLTMATGLQPAGFPHSDISGSIPVCRSPELFAAYHVLLRFRKPRHPPFALVLFLFVNHLRLFVSSFYSFCLEIVALQLEKTRIILQTIISFYLVISLSIVNELFVLFPLLSEGDAKVHIFFYPPNFFSIFFKYFSKIFFDPKNIYNTFDFCYILFIFALNIYGMQTSSKKIQTAFRLDENLLMRAKLRAKREQRSLNSLVEEALERMMPQELEWPKVVIPTEISPDILAMRLPGKATFTKEEIAADERLAHALGEI